MTRSLVLAAGLAAAASSVDAKVQIDPMKHAIQQIYPHNFDNVIGATLPLTVSAVWYYKGSNAGDANFLKTWNDVAEKMKKMVKITALDCDDHAKHCDREGVKDSGVMLYPQAPRPKFKYEGSEDSESYLKALYKLIPGDKIQTLAKADDYNSLKKKSPTKVKIVLFSDKKKPPTVLKGLSTDSVFARTVEFAFVGPDGAEVSEAAGAGKKKLPAIQLIAKGKGQWYKEKDFSFEAIHSWINLFSESGMGDTVKGAGAEEVEAEEAEYEKVGVNLFSESGMGDTIKGAGAEEVEAEEAEYEKVGVNLFSESGMGDTVKGAGAEEVEAEEAEYEKVGGDEEAEYEKVGVNLFSESGMGDTVKGAGAEEVEAEEAEYEKVRELHAKSQNDLCFKQKNVCAIWLQKGSELADKDADAITNMETKFAPKTDRGIRYNWMWMDIEQEAEFKAALDEQEKKVAEKEGRDVEPLTYPTMLFVKPPKKKREERLLSYIRMESGKKVTGDSVGDMVEKISGGAMYTRVDLPRMAVRAPKGKKDAKDAGKKAGKEEL